MISFRVRVIGCLSFWGMAAVLVDDTSPPVHLVRALLVVLGLFALLYRGRQ